MTEVSNGVSDTWWSRAPFASAEAEDDVDDSDDHLHPNESDDGLPVDTNYLDTVARPASVVVNAVRNEVDDHGDEQEAVRASHVTTIGGRTVLSTFQSPVHDSKVAARSDELIVAHTTTQAAREDVVLATDNERNGVRDDSGSSDEHSHRDDEVEERPDGQAEVDVAGNGDDGNDSTNHEVADGESGRYPTTTIVETKMATDIPWISLGDDAVPASASAARKLAEVRDYQAWARSELEQSIGVPYSGVPVTQLTDCYERLGLAFASPIFIVPDASTIATIGLYDEYYAGRAYSFPFEPDETYGNYSQALHAGFVHVDDITPRIATVTTAHECGGHGSEDERLYFAMLADGSRVYAAGGMGEGYGTGINEITIDWTANLVTAHVFRDVDRVQGGQIAQHGIPFRYTMSGHDENSPYTWGQMAVDAAICRGGQVDERLFEVVLHANSSQADRDMLYDYLDCIAPGTVEGLLSSPHHESDTVLQAAQDMFARFTDRSDPSAAVHAADVTQHLLQRALHR